MRWRASCLLLLLTIAAGAQEPRDNPQTPREFSRAVAKVIRRYPEVCRANVAWVLAFDMSRSGMGRWNEWARQVVSDLITFVFVEGDKLVLIPFDVEVNPARQGRSGGQPFPSWPVTEATKPAMRAEVAELLLWRQGSPDGTAWVKATQAALRTTATVKATSPNLLGVTLVISDRDSSDLIQDERSVVQQIQGLKEPGQSLWPLPRDVKPIVLLHAVAATMPQASATPQRFMPPWEPPASQASRLIPVPTAPPASRRPVVAWLLAAVLALIGGLLLVSGATLRGQVKVKWGWREGDPSRQVTVALPVEQRRLVGVAAEPAADPFTVYADGPDNPVQRKSVLPDLASLTATPDGVLLRASDQYLVRAAGEPDWGNEVFARRGGAPVFLEFRLASQTWLLTRQPIGLQVLPQGHDWRQRLILGGVALAAALLIGLLARPGGAAPMPTLPVPTGPTTAPVEPFCGG